MASFTCRSLFLALTGVAAVLSLNEVVSAAGVSDRRNPREDQGGRKRPQAYVRAVFRHGSCTPINRRLTVRLHVSFLKRRTPE